MRSGSSAHLEQSDGKLNEDSSKTGIKRYRAFGTALAYGGGFS